VAIAQQYDAGVVVRKYTFISRAVCFVSALLTLSCGDIFGGGCAKPQTMDAIYNDGFYNIELQLVQGWRDKGYDCNSVSLRDAFGNAYGDRYTCTKC
jgi:hypothetical protein